MINSYPNQTGPVNPVPTFASMWGRPQGDPVTSNLAATWLTGNNSGPAPQPVNRMPGGLGALLGAPSPTMVTPQGGNYARPAGGAGNSPAPTVTATPGITTTVGGSRPTPDFSGFNPGVTPPPLYRYPVVEDQGFQGRQTNQRFEGGRWPGLQDALSQQRFAPKVGNSLGGPGKPGRGLI